MMELNRYIKELDGICRDVLKRYSDAEQETHAAEREAQRYTRPGTNPEAQLQQLKSQAAHKEAQLRRDALRRDALEGQTRREIKELRERLAQAIENEFAADPAALDVKSLELLKSGIMTGSDFRRMIHGAVENENWTLARLAAKYATEAANEREKNPIYGNDATARELRIIALEGTEHNGDRYLETYDYLADVFGRCIDNPAMISAWDELSPVKA